LWTHHVRPLFNGKDKTAQADWENISNIFWRLCKTSDESQCRTFDSDYNHLAELVKKHAQSLSESNNKKYINLMKWLESLRIRKEAWAGCYTWQHRTFGVHSTQRAEAMHSVIAIFCSKSHTIMQLVELLENLAKEQSAKREFSNLKNAFNDAIGKAAEDDSPMVAYLVQRLHPFAQHIVRAQAGQTGCYSFSVNNSDSNGLAEHRIHLVRRQRSPTHDKDMNDAAQRRTHGRHRRRTPKIAGGPDSVLTK
jgi:hypothetical protein